MRILVAVASRHGSTREIGERIAARLRDAGADVHLADISHVEGLAGVDAVVLGSALYMGAWEQPARLFIEEHAADLSRVPLWIFSSGPIGSMGADSGGQRGHASAVDALNPVDSRIFGGKLDLDGLSRRERFLCKLLRVKEGDFRDWEAIDHWARDIQTALMGTHAIAAEGRMR